MDKSIDWTSLNCRRCDNCVIVINQILLQAIKIIHFLSSFNEFALPDGVLYEMVSISVLAQLHIIVMAH